MGSKKIISLICLFAGSIFFMVLLYFQSYRINHSKNGFIRLFPPHVTGASKEIDIRYNSYFLAGMSATDIYLGNKTSSDFLISDYNLADTHHVKLQFPAESEITIEAAQIRVDSPYIYFLDGLTPAYLLGHLSDYTLTQKKWSNEKFGGAIPLTPASVIFKTYDNKIQQNVLKKTNLDSSFIVGREFIPEKQGDGIFSVDGMLRFSKNASKIIYLYYYRNEFICLDTNLSIIYKNQTIDTTHQAKLKIAKLNSGNDITMAAPPVIVNRESCLSDKYLFINSGLRANNETENNFANHSVIDVYSLDKGNYLFSFYMATFKGKKLDRFIVYRDTLVAIYDHYLVSMKLNF